MPSLNGLFLDPKAAASPADLRDSRQAGHDDAGEHGSAPTAPAATTSSRARPASPPATRSRPPGSRPGTWTTATTDPRALQVPGSPNRVAAVWYSPTSFSVDVNLGDGLAHDLELYLLDWAISGRAETVQITDATTGAVLSTQTISSFQSGDYLDYVVSGHIVIKITRTAGANAVVERLIPRLAVTSWMPKTFDKWH